jgi:hypothetical protein
MLKVSQIQKYEKTISFKYSNIQKYKTEKHPCFAPFRVFLGL